MIYYVHYYRLVPGGWFRCLSFFLRHVRRPGHGYGPFNSVVCVRMGPREWASYWCGEHSEFLWAGSVEKHLMGPRLALVTHHWSASQWRAFQKTCCQLTSLQVMWFVRDSALTGTAFILCLMHCINVLPLLPTNQPKSPSFGPWGKSLLSLNRQTCRLRPRPLYYTMNGV